MPTVELTNVIEGARGVRSTAGAPTAGTDEVQTLTIGGTPTGGTFRLALNGVATAAITWVNVNATLIGNINAALDALFGASAIVAAVGTMTAGIGTATLTFSGGAFAKRAMPTMTVYENALTGSAPTLAIAETTPGVNASGIGSPKGGLLQDTTNGKLYINTGTDTTPTWTVVGTQT